MHSPRLPVVRGWRLWRASGRHFGRSEGLLGVPLAWLGRWCQAGWVPDDRDREREALAPAPVDDTRRADDPVRDQEPTSAGQREERDEDYSEDDFIDDEDGADGSGAAGEVLGEAWGWSDEDRAAWLDWDQRVRQAKAEAERTGEPVRLPPAPDAGGGGGLIFLTVDDPRIDGYVEPSEPAGLSAEQRQRRALADRLAGILVNSDVGDERAEYAVASLALPAKVRYARAVRSALLEAPEVAERSEPGAVKVQSGAGGVVIRLHGPSWSMVFRYSPLVEPVLFVTDGMPERARRVDTDEDWLPEIETAVAAVVGELSRFSLGGDKYLYRPLSTGEPED